MKKFKVGDRVKFIGNIHSVYYSLLHNKKGTIVSIKDNGWVCVEWDNDVDGHSCGGKTKKVGHGWSVSNDELSIISNPKKVKTI